MDTVIVIMLKNKNTGFFEKELISLTLTQYDEFIVNLFAEEETNEKIDIHMKLSTQRDVLDWEYAAIYDCYDIDIDDNDIKSVEEVDDCFNPTWEFVFNYKDDSDYMENIVSKILLAHKEELDKVYEIIKNKEKEYNEK